MWTPLSENPSVRMPTGSRRSVSLFRYGPPPQPTPLRTPLGDPPRHQPRVPVASTRRWARRVPPHHGSLAAEARQERSSGDRMPATPCTLRRLSTAIFLAADRPTT
ncbi:hypothetical protein HPB50_022268 [Hyalomma asiaticum]|uniref:Uncharacterized protein n=1 Tax=Hyalomma asiaticum TaxID=266040 RepID=A0ACB7T5X0_HYAAI|nr:hypothetical protein HPB50_022268 [Hyalomma asiaticum]